VENPHETETGPRHYALLFPVGHHPAPRNDRLRRNLHAKGQEASRLVRNSTAAETPGVSISSEQLIRIQVGTVCDIAVEMTIKSEGVDRMTRPIRSCNLWSAGSSTQLKLSLLIRFPLAPNQIEVGPGDGVGRYFDDARRFANGGLLSGQLGQQIPRFISGTIA